MDPDILLASEPYGDGPVPLATAKLVIEIGDTGLKLNLTRKAALYARLASGMLGGGRARAGDSPAVGAGGRGLCRAA